VNQISRAYCMLRTYLVTTETPEDESLEKKKFPAESSGGESENRNGILRQRRTTVLYFDSSPFTCVGFITCLGVSNH
jgi:hypothetical protein